MTNTKTKPTLKALYNRYSITIEYLTDLEGGVPNNKDMIRNWIKARMKKSGRDLAAEELEKLVNETLASTPKLAANEVTEGLVADSLLWTTFKRDSEGRPQVEARCIKAFFKENANILKEILAEEAKAEGRGQRTKKDGTEASAYNTMYRSKVAEQLFVEGVLYPLTRDGKTLDDVDGRVEKAIHVTTPQGRRDALKRFDFIAAPTQLTFTVRVLRNGVVTEHDLLRMLEHGQMNGLGSGRSQGSGQFRVVEVAELEPLEAMPLVIKRRTAKKEG